MKNWLYRITVYDNNTSISFRDKKAPNPNKKEAIREVINHLEKLIKNGCV